MPKRGLMFLKHEKCPKTRSPNQNKGVEHKVSEPPQYGRALREELTACNCGLDSIMQQQGIFTGCVGAKPSVSSEQVGRSPTEVTREADC